jgi:hypothetical protein
MFPPEFWIELARLEGIKYSPQHRPIRWGKYVMMFVYDAVDPDVGRELRNVNPQPPFQTGPSSVAPRSRPGQDQQPGPAGHRDYDALR